MNFVRTQIHELTLDAKVKCVNCNKEIPLHLTCADTEGKPFHDYYCFTCVENLRKLGMVSMEAKG